MADEETPTVSADGESIVVIYGDHSSAGCRAVFVFLAESEIDFEFKEVDVWRGQNPHAGNPRHGSIPTMDDDGFIVYGGFAIMGYLARKHGVFGEYFSEDPAPLALIEQYMHWYHNNLKLPCIMVVRYTVTAPLLGKQCDALGADENETLLRTSLAHLDKVLSNRKFLGRDASVADIAFAAQLSQLTFVSRFAEDPSLGHQHVARWLQDVAARYPSFVTVHATLPEIVTRVMTRLAGSDAMVHQRDREKELEAVRVRNDPNRAIVTKFQDNTEASGEGSVDSSTDSVPDEKGEGEDSTSDDDDEGVV